MIRNITVALAVFALTTFTQAATIHVNPGDSIQTAITGSATGDEIVVHPGTYVERINLSGRAITLRSSDGPAVTIIDGDAIGTVITCVSGEGADTVIEGFTITNGSAPSGGGMKNENASPTVTDCIFDGNWATDVNPETGGGGMHNTGASPMVTGCTFRENESGYAGGGMYNDTGADPTLINIVFSSNFAGNRGGGIYVADQSNPTLINCTLSGNRAFQWGGAVFSDSTQTSLTNCILWGSTVPSGVPQVYGYGTITYSAVDGGWDGTGNIAADPLFVDADNHDVHLQSGSPCLNAGDDDAVPGDVTIDFDGDDRVQQCHVDMGADETTAETFPDCNQNGVPDDCDVEEGASGDCNENGIPDECDIDGGSSEDFNVNGIPDECDQIHNVTQNIYHLTIQWAIDAAESGNVIDVGPGTYLERINLMGKAITLRSSDGPAVTIIDGDAIGTVITCVSSEGSDTVIEGFTITNGSADSGGGIYSEHSSPTLSGCIFRDNSARLGGGMFSGADGSPALTGCSFEGNSADHGGGMYTYTGGNTPALINCRFEGNSAGYGGGMYNNGSVPTLTGCTFSENSATSGGGGMYNSSSSPALTGCTFSENSTTGDGGGMLNRSGGTPTLIGCTFSGNAAGYAGGGLCNYPGGAPTLTNCLLSGNSAENRGGGMHNSQGSNSPLINCTFSGNSAGIRGGGMNNEGSSPELTNCILWGNAAPNGPQIHGGSVVTHSCIQDGWPGTGNISDTPMFIDADGPDNVVGTPDDDLRLVRTLSPCIDAGNNAALPADTLDLDGDGDTDEPIPFDLGDDPRFVDDSVRPDTGNGTSPVVDMGVYESQVSMATGADLDGDGDVDLNDFMLFQQQFTGPQP